MSEENGNIKNVIDQLFRKGSRLSKSYNQFTVEEIWRSLFGEVISSYTTKIYFKEDILTVYISSSALREEILMNKKQILEKLNSHLQYRKVLELRVR